MENLELNSSALAELTFDEMESIDGGLFASGGTWFCRGFGYGLGVGGAVGFAYYFV